MKKIFTLIVALIATMSVNAETIGNTDNSSDWWTAFSEAYTVNEGEKAVVSFVNHNPGSGDNWFNWLVVITSPNAGVPVLNTETNAYVWPNGSPEYGVIRQDNWGWGTYFDRWQENEADWAAVYTIDGGIWDNFMAKLNGAQVEVTMQKDDEGHFVLEAVTTKDGNSYNYKVVSKAALPAGGFGFFFTVQNAHLTDFTVTVEKQAVASTHTYDFTAWSDETIAALKADAAASKTEGWSDVEKKADAEAGADPTEISKDNCFWCVATPNADGTLSANGVVIKELGNLKFNETYSTARSLAIAVNYPETTLGTYAGPSYLWLGGKEKICFTIPNVAAGSTITVCAESHKPSDARGIQLQRDGVQIGEAFTPTTQDTYTWTIDTAGDVDVYNTQGCHIYYIDVKAGGSSVNAAQAAPVKVQPKKVLTKDGIIIGGKYTIGGALVK